MVRDGLSGSVAGTGLGSMGLGTARSPVRDGFAIAGHHPAPSAAHRHAAAGGRAATSLDGAARGADVVVAVVVGADHTGAALFGPDRSPPMARFAVGPTPGFTELPFLDRCEAMP